MIKAVTDENYEEEVLRSDIPVIVDFYADWCVPCKMMAPVLDMVDKEKAGKVKIVKINTDENPEITTKNRVMSIPTLLFVNKGEVKARVEGAVTKSVVDSKLEKAMR